MPTRECTNPHYSHKYGVSKGRYPIEFIHQLVKKNECSPANTRIDIDGDMINITSDRLRTFRKKGVRCVSCGIAGDHYIKEKSSAKEPLFHLNLYHTTKKGRHILMTRDHIIPSSKGGRNILSNLQPMCAPCNERKGDSYGHGSENRGEEEGYTYPNETSGLPKGVH